MFHAPQIGNFWSKQGDKTHSDLQFQVMMKKFLNNIMVGNLGRLAQLFYMHFVAKVAKQNLHSAEMFFWFMTTIGCGSGAFCNRRIKNSIHGKRNFCQQTWFHKIIWQSIWSKLASWTYSGIKLDIKVFFLFGALPSDTLKIKHTKNLKEIPSRDALENLPEKACMNAFIHLKLISNVQGFN